MFRKLEGIMNYVLIYVIAPKNIDPFFRMTPVTIFFIIELPHYFVSSQQIVLHLVG